MTETIDMYSNISTEEKEVEQFVLNCFNILMDRNNKQNNIMDILSERLSKLQEDINANEKAIVLNQKDDTEENRINQEILNQKILDAREEIFLIKKAEETEKKEREKLEKERIEEITEAQEETQRKVEENLTKTKEINDEFEEKEEKSRVRMERLESEQKKNRDERERKREAEERRQRIEILKNSINELNKEIQNIVEQIESKEESSKDKTKQSTSELDGENYESAIQFAKDAISDAHEVDTRAGVLETLIHELESITQQKAELEVENTQEVNTLNGGHYMLSGGKDVVNINVEQYILNAERLKQEAKDALDKAQKAQEAEKKQKIIDQEIENAKVLVNKANQESDKIKELANSIQSTHQDLKQAFTTATKNDNNPEAINELKRIQSKIEGALEGFRDDGSMNIKPDKLITSNYNELNDLIAELREINNEISKSKQRIESYIEQLEKLNKEEIEKKLSELRTEEEKREAAINRFEQALDKYKSIPLEPKYGINKNPPVYNKEHVKKETTQKIKEKTTELELMTVTLNEKIAKATQAYDAVVTEFEEIKTTYNNKLQGVSKNYSNITLKSYDIELGNDETISEINKKISDINEKIDELERLKAEEEAKAQAAAAALAQATDEFDASNLLFEEQKERVTNYLGDSLKSATDAERNLAGLLGKSFTMPVNTDNIKSKTAEIKAAIAGLNNYTNENLDKYKDPFKDLQEIIKAANGSFRGLEELNISGSEDVSCEHAVLIKLKTDKETFIEEYNKYTQIVKSKKIPQDKNLENIKSFFNGVMSNVETLQNKIKKWNSLFKKYNKCPPDERTMRIKDWVRAFHSNFYQIYTIIYGFFKKSNDKKKKIVEKFIEEEAKNINNLKTKLEKYIEIITGSKLINIYTDDNPEGLAKTFLQKYNFDSEQQVATLIKGNEPPEKKNIQEAYKVLYEDGEWNPESVEMLKIFKLLLLSMNGLAGGFVKIWDKNDDITKQDSVLKTNLRDKKITALKNTEICGKSEQYKEMSGKEFGPFKGVFDRKENNTKHSNTDVFNFIKEDYRMFEEIGFEVSFDTETKSEGQPKNKNFRLFAFGYSGSGKTYTLVKGGDKDPSVMTNTIRYLIEKSSKTEAYTHEEGDLSDKQKTKKEHWKHVAKTGFKGLDIQIYYPLEHNNQNEPKPISLNKKGNIKAKLTAIEKIDGNNKLLLNTLSVKIQELVDEVEKVMIENCYIVPTTNNPNSSRAFTVYTIKTRDDGTSGNIYFVDMPGNEKTSLIKTDFLFNEEFVKKLQSDYNSYTDTTLSPTTGTPTTGTPTTGTPTTGTPTTGAPTTGTPTTGTPTTLNAVEQMTALEYARLQETQFDNIPNTRDKEKQLTPGKKKQLTFIGTRDEQDESIKRESSATDSNINLIINKKFLEKINLTNLHEINNSIVGIKLNKDMKLSDSTLGRLAKKHSVMWSDINTLPIGQEKKDLNFWESKRGSTAALGYEKQFLLANYILITKLLNRKAELKPNNDTNNKIYLVPTKEMTKTFYRQFLITIKEKLFKDGTNLGKTQSYQSQSEPTKKKFLNNIFNTVFNPFYYYNKEEIPSISYSKDIPDIKTTEPKSIPRRFFKEDFVENNLKSNDLKVERTKPCPYSDIVIKHYNLKSPIIYLYLLLIHKYNGNSDRDNFLRYYFSIRIIDFITSQGDAINTALENHKFVFLKRSDYFQDCNNSNSKDSHPYKLMCNGETDIAGDKGNITFEDQKYTINVNIAGNDYEEQINRKYLPNMNRLLYKEFRGSNSEEKFITLIAIYRLMENLNNNSQQHERCKFAIESLQFANQISGNEPEGLSIISKPAAAIVAEGGSINKKKRKYKKKTNKRKNSKLGKRNSKRNSRKKRIFRY